MHRHLRFFLRLCSVVAFSMVLAITPALAQSRYKVRYLVSNGTIAADHIDSNLVDPWGLAFDPYGFAWVASPASRAVMKYDGNGVSQPPLVRVPVSAYGNLRPFGIVFNGGYEGFITCNANGLCRTSRFLMTTDIGSIHGWNPETDPAVAFYRFNSGSLPYLTGMALSGCCGRQLLYAVLPGQRGLPVFDNDANGNIKRSSMPVGAFYDPALPADLALHNVQAIGGNIYAAYARFDGFRPPNAVPAAGAGRVTVFTPSGRLIRVISTGGALNAPWGMAMAPAEFGDHSNKLLVANLGDGRINVFDPTSGAHLGCLRDASGNPIVIDGLRAVQFGNGVANQSVNTLYFTAGPVNGAAGLYGRVDLIR
ncbi:TIGR03118 family protein [Lysobacter sp. MMG2]|uniref:TIGR03118 family protein n=1 Tax=Lysobacter sp. MMG2 TaxID=2801338 RepID=UPI001C241C1E|nr:TIGR03118 family protein [Lysobacter sp. MMG2]MBU8978184.1 TIGR03118 family protein [Lysobacter sp. MMG2]